MSDKNIAATAFSVEDAIAGHPFSKGLNPRHLQLLNGCASWQRVGAGQFIFSEGASAERFYLIHQGRVSLGAFVPDRGQVVVQTLETGEALGCSWLFTPYKWQFTARTLESCELIVLNAAGLREHMEKDRDFGCELYARVAGMLAHRLQATRRRLIRFYDPTEQHFDALPPFE